MATQYLYTLSTAVFLHHKCQLSIVSDKIINNSDNFRIKSLSDSEIGAIMCYLFSVFSFSYLILKKMSTFKRNFRFPCLLLYLTLVTSCKFDPFLCCHLLYLIIYLVEIKFKISPHLNLHGLNKKLNIFWFPCKVAVFG